MLKERHDPILVDQAVEDAYDSGMITAPYFGDHVLGYIEEMAL